MGNEAVLGWVVEDEAPTYNIYNYSVFSVYICMQWMDVTNLVAIPLMN